MASVASGIRVRCLGVLMLELWKADRGLRLCGDFAHMLSAIAARSPAQPAIDYKALALRVAHATPPGGHAPLAALRLLSDEAHAVERGERVREMEDALRLLLGGTRDAHTSPTMRVIQHFTLGSSLYTEVYRQPAQFETGSLLREFDRPTLSQKESRALDRPCAERAVGLPPTRCACRGRSICRRTGWSPRRRRKSRSR
ncbi:MAG: hypothetical protein NTY23_04705 [Chloroflexi bacterium]|nr:hypothetical protein [Chloroflexota bacterium]